MCWLRRSVCFKLYWHVSYEANNNDIWREIETYETLKQKTRWTFRSNWLSWKILSTYTNAWNYSTRTSRHDQCRVDGVVSALDSSVKTDDDRWPIAQHFIIKFANQHTYDAIWESSFGLFCVHANFFRSIYVRADDNMSPNTKQITKTNSCKNTFAVENKTHLSLLNIFA